MITNIISERKLDIISDFIARYGKIAITCHVSPDGDAMGSTLGLCHFLKGLGKQATVVIPDMPPRNLIFYPECAMSLYILKLQKKLKRF